MTPLILVVEDDELVRLSLAHLLTHAGYRVQAAADRDEAIRLVELEPPRLILLDWHIPWGMDGPAFAAALHERGLRQACPILLACGDPTAEKAQAVGAIGAMGKPFQLNELLERVAGALAQCA